MLGYSSKCLPSPGPPSYVHRTATFNSSFTTNPCSVYLRQWVCGPKGSQADFQLLPELSHQISKVFRAHCLYYDFGQPTPRSYSREIGHKLFKKKRPCRARGPQKPKYVFGVGWGGESSGKCKRKNTNLLRLPLAT